MGAVRRRRGASSLVLLCAMAILTAPGLATGTAYAAPAAPAAPGAPATPASPGNPGAPLPGPGGKSLEQVRKDIEELYRQAGTATDAYNLAEAETKTQSEKIVEIANLVVAGQERITTLKSRAGAAARLSTARADCRRARSWR